MKENSKISIHNYEEYIVNYLDGQLSPVEAAELFLFLEMHPELGEDLDELAEMTTEPDMNIVYGFKDALKLSHDADAQQISSENYLYYFTAYAEGDLSAKGIDAVHYFIHQNPGYKNELLILQNCKVEASIVYPNKSELKRKPGLLIPMPVRWAAFAASLLLLFTVYVRHEQSSTELLNQPLTQTETIIKEAPSAEIATTNPADTASLDDEQLSQKTEDEKNGATAKPKKERPAKSIIDERAPALQVMPSLTIALNHTLPVDFSLRDTYSSLFDDISLSQQIWLAYAENHPEDDQQNNSPYGLNVGRRFNQYLQSGTQIANQVSESFSGWMLADIGVKGINLLTDKDLRLVRDVQQNGTTGEVVLKSDDTSYILKRADY